MFQDVDLLRDFQSDGQVAFGAVGAIEVSETTKTPGASLEIDLNQLNICS